jgi:GT2 family glycosyltransferase
VIPNYNGKQLLQQILPHLYKALSTSGFPYEVIVPDDCSTDDSVAFLKVDHPEILLIESPVNQGFSPTINKGIFAANYEHLLLLNSDVKLTEDYFDGLSRYFEREDTFGVMGRIVGWEDDIIQDGGKYPVFHGAKIKTTGNYIPLEPDENDWLYSMYLSGANALISKKKLLELDGFDEIFAPFYVEDYELSLRAWRLGYKCYYHHQSVCRHKISVSIKTKNSKDYINAVYYRNKMFLHAMHLQGSTKVLWYLQLVPELLIRLVTLRFYYLRSLGMFFRGHKRMHASMKRFDNISNDRKRLSVSEVAELIRSNLKEKKITKL